MNTTLYRSTPHPPDTEDRTVLRLPAADELRRLSLADRLSLRVGLWLLQRAQRPHRSRPLSTSESTDALRLDRRRASASEALALSAFDLQRQLR